MNHKWTTTNGTNNIVTRIFFSLWNVQNWANHKLNVNEYGVWEMFVSVCFDLLSTATGHNIANFYEIKRHNIAHTKIAAILYPNHFPQWQQNVASFDHSSHSRCLYRSVSHKNLTSSCSFWLENQVDTKPHYKHTFIEIRMKACIFEIGLENGRNHLYTCLHIHKHGISKME